MSTPLHSPKQELYIPPRSEGRKVLASKSRQNRHPQHALVSRARTPISLPGVLHHVVVPPEWGRSKMGTVETQLRMDVQSQYDDIQETFQIFNCSRSNLQEENHTKIPGYDTIKELSKAHGNMVETHRYVRRFQAFQQQIEHIEKLLDKAKAAEELPSNLLLLLHYELFHVEEFRDITLHRAKKCSQDVVDAVAESFAEVLWAVARDVIRWVEQDKLHYMVHIVKIVEREEQADRRAQQAEVARSAHLKMAKTSGSRWKLAEGSPRQTKSYKSKLMAILREAINKRITQSVKGEKRSIYSALDALEAVPADLKLLEDTLAKAFPPEFHIMDFFLAEHHSQVHRQLGELVADTNKLEGGEILRVLRFVQDYHDELFRVLGVAEDVLEPALLGGNQARLVEAYISIASGKLMEWTENLLKLDMELFLTRDREPQTNPEGKYFLSASGTAFQAYDQQIDIAADANSARVLVEVVKCCVRAAQIYQQRFSEALASELRSYLEDPSSVSQGLAEYTIALMNDQLRSVDMGEPLAAKLSGMLLDVYRERAVGYINEMSDGFFKLASQGHEILLQIIFNDLKPVFTQLYTNVWYEEELMLCIVATFQDYCEDARQQLNEYLFDLLMNKLIEHFLVEAIKALRNPKALFRLPEYTEKAGKDMLAIQDFFATYLEPKAVSDQLDPLIRLQGSILIL
ncbi:SNARE-binding exocyst subunit S6 [Massospora cicadina]|nr:SNARE-binding exocyst subunit S6 [Massospora cicadina]